MKLLQAHPEGEVGDEGDEGAEGFDPALVGEVA